MADEKDNENLGPTTDGRTRVKLAHPLNDQDVVRLGLDPQKAPYRVNDVVEVRRDDARALIGAGLVQVDPEDVRAVGAALGSRRSSVEPAQGDGSGASEPYADLKGDALDEAVKKAGLPVSGTAKEKREALAARDAANATA